LHTGQEDSQGEAKRSSFFPSLRRVTSSGRFIPEIDGLRFVAIATVVIFHLVVGLAAKSPSNFTIPQGNVFTQIALTGFHGVELFFIISGFILGLPFASHYILGKKKASLGQYFLRRLTRLEPPYIICMIGLFVLLVSVRSRSPQELISHLAASLAYLHNAFFGTESLINNVTWSLEIEVQFYLLVPILSRLFAIKNSLLRRSVILFFCVSSILGGWLYILPGGWLHLTILEYLHFFLIGFFLADLYLTAWKQKPITNTRWDLVAVIGWPLLFFIWVTFPDRISIVSTGREHFIPVFVFPFLALVLYVAAFKGRITRELFVRPWLTSIGGMCYTIYLFHNPFFGFFFDYTKEIAPSSLYLINLGIQSILVIPCLLLVSTIYFLIIERPCMQKDWPMRLGKRTLELWSEAGEYGANPRKLLQLFKGRHGSANE